MLSVSNPTPVMSFLLPAMAGYLIWWIPYTVWLLVSGLDHSVQRTGKLTVFRDNLARNSAMSLLLVGKRKASEQDLESRWVGLKYMLVHAFLCLLALLWSYLCYGYYWVHSCFCCVLFVSAAFQGGSKYYKMTTQWYLRAVEKNLAHM